MTTIRASAACALLAFLSLAACGGDPGDALTLATSESDAQVMRSIVGTWAGSTPDGPVTLTFCEDLAPLRTVPDLHGALRCPTVAHESRDEGRSPTERVDLEPEQRSDELFGGHQSRTCDRVMAAPLAMRLEAWCQPTVFHGAMVLAARPTLDPYQGPFQLGLEAPVVAGASVIAQRTFIGELTDAGALRAEYSTARYCSAPRCGSDDPVGTSCVPGDGVLPMPTIMVEFHRTGPALCPIDG